MNEAGFSAQSVLDPDTCWCSHVLKWATFFKCPILAGVYILAATLADIWKADCVPTVFLGAGVNLFTADTVSSSGEGQDLDAVVSVFLQPIQLQRWFDGGHILDLPQFCWKASKEVESHV